MRHPRAERDPAQYRRGIAFCVLSGVCFGTLAIFARSAYDAGVALEALLAWRFSVAAVVLWAVALFARHGRPLARHDGDPDKVRTRGQRVSGRRVVVTGLLLGAAGYSLQALLYLSAIKRIDISLAALLLYTFPVLVALGAWRMGRDTLGTNTLLALGCTTTGAAIMLLGRTSSAQIASTGIALALGAAVVYACYILVSDTVIASIDPLRLAALVCTGAAMTYLAACLIRQQPLVLQGWDAVVPVMGVALVATVVAITAFFAGLRRAGPSTTSILSTIEPLVTVVLGVAMLDERLTLVQLGGGVLILAAVPLLERRAAQ